MKRIGKMVVFLLFFMGLNVSAQHVRFIEEGLIEFERSTNMYAVLNKRLAERNSNMMNEVVDQVKKTMPQFKRAKSILYFSKNKTLFQPVADAAAPISFIVDDPAFNQLNVIYSDLASQQQTAQKKVYEQTFLVADSMRKINWKITEERREIAGYSCRRANALIMDSIYVVAFYADEIPVTGGPESFSGLPGMILGIALPHENVTWFAKRVEDKAVDSKLLVPPVKGKRLDKSGLISTLKQALKGWGAYMNTALKIYLL